MIKKKMLVVALYPMVNPQHGGQKRVKAIFEFYSSIFSEVKFVGVYHRGLYPDHGSDDLLLGQPDIIEQIDKNPQAAELTTGRAIADDIHVRSYMAKLLREYKPDIIHAEQVFPYLGLRPLLQDINMSPRIILGSHNIEHRMKKGIYKNLGLPQELTESLVGQIKDLEYSFSREANLVVAVSKQDAKMHKEMGARRCIVAPNGIEKNKPTKKAIGYWRNFKRDKDIKNIITFVGSGHPPNWMGFIELVSKNTTFLPKGAKILMAGGVSEYFSATYPRGSEDKKYNKLWRGVLALGKLSEGNLAGLLGASDIILLPITSGGGSNLKTAEAILSGKKIVATTYAFRGFEKYLDLPNIYTANNKNSFQEAIAKAIKAKYIERTPEQVHLAEQVRWQYCLKPIKPALKKILRTSFKEKARLAKGLIVQILQTVERCISRIFKIKR